MIGAYGHAGSFNEPVPTYNRSNQLTSDKHAQSQLYASDSRSIATRLESVSSLDYLGVFWEAFGSGVQSSLSNFTIHRAWLCLSGL